MDNILYFHSVLRQHGKNRFYRAIYVVNDELPYTIEVTQGTDGFFYEKMDGFYIHSAGPIPIEELIDDDTVWHHL